MTLPLIRTLKKCNVEEKSVIKRVIEKSNRDGNDMAEVLSLVRHYDGINYSLNKAKTCIDEGKGYLVESFGDSEARETLFAISDYVVERKL
jgi:octaprenyl-diphosphate synthase